MRKNRMAVRIMAGVVSAAVLAAVPVCAEKNEPSKSMDVKYQEDDSYILSIPADVTLDADSGATETLGVKEANIQPGMVLNIKITTDTAELTRTGDDAGSEKKVTSEITVAGISSLSGALSTSPVTIGTYKGTITTETKEQTITFGKPADADGDGIINAGTYTGSITFVAKVEKGN